MAALVPLELEGEGERLAAHVAAMLTQLGEGARVLARDVVLQVVLLNKLFAAYIALKVSDCVVS